MSSSSPTAESGPAVPVAAGGCAPDDPHRVLNRELSWLEFNERVLALADDPSIPLLERATFLAIFSQNLDEFFQDRVAGLLDQVAAGIRLRAPDGRSPTAQVRELAARARVLVDREERLFLEKVAPELAANGIVLSSWEELDDDDRQHMVGVFQSRIFPVLTPLAVDPGHPFPYISNLSLNLAVTVRDPVTEERRFARVKVPPVLSRFVVMPDGERFVPLEQVIAAHLDQLFPGMVIDDHVAFRVTRNADLTLEEEEADDLLAAVEMELRRRRFGRSVRLEIDAEASPEVRELLMRELDVDEHAVFEHVGPLDLGGLWAVHALDRPDLRDEAWPAVTQARLSAPDGEPFDIFEAIAEGPILVHHPYDSFVTSVEELVHRASRDLKTLAIKITLYRTSGDSPIVRSLVRAVNRGKQVAALVELQARFDEANNIEWAKVLEEAGVHVTYGLLGLKTHTKTLLVVRDEDDGIRRYCHVGTGNYNSKTATRYEDLGVLSADPDLGADLTQLFNYLTGYGRNISYRRLMVAPHSLRPGITDLIEGEVAAGPGRGRIVMKMNSLVDPQMIDQLYAASCAGVEIDLIVRGICCLRPGVPGLSERIRVRSLVGRYLEHSRIYWFANGTEDDQPLVTFGSADLMPRNLDRRVEALTVVSDPAIEAQVREVLDVNLADDSLAWTLDADGAWQPIKGDGTVHAQEHFRALALARTRRLEDADSP